MVKIMTDCLFCKIVKKEINADIIYENNSVLAFKDINPQSPVHILVIPKKHISSLNELQEQDINILSDLFKAIKKIVKDFNIEKDGYRVVINTNKNGGQEVQHLHFHILGGRQLNWPPG